MKLDVLIFKRSGKFYTSGEIEVPDGLQMWGEERDKIVEEACKKSVSGVSGMDVVVREKPENSFFTYLHSYP